MTNLGGDYRVPKPIRPIVLVAAIVMAPVVAIGGLIVMGGLWAMTQVRGGGDVPETDLKGINQRIELAFSSIPHVVQLHNVGYTMPSELKGGQGAVGGSLMLDGSDPEIQEQVLREAGRILVEDLRDDLSDDTLVVIWVRNRQSALSFHDLGMRGIRISDLEEFLKK